MRFMKQFTIIIITLILILFASDRVLGNTHPNPLDHPYINQYKDVPGYWEKTEDGYFLFVKNQRIKRLVDPTDPQWNVQLDYIHFVLRACSRISGFAFAGKLAAEQKVDVNIVVLDAKSKYDTFEDYFNQIVPIYWRDVTTNAIRLAYDLDFLSYTPQQFGEFVFVECVEREVANL